MKLGMIASVSEESFKLAKSKGLSFLEFCLNIGYDTVGFIKVVPQIKQWSRQYQIGVQSIGRWGSDKFNQKGEVNVEELEINQKLIRAASELECANYICGVNYVEGLSLYENASLTIEYLTKLLIVSEKHGVNLSVNNCRWNNWVVNPRAWELICGYLPDLGIKYDSSHSIYAGDDYLQEMRDWGQRFYHVHIKGALTIKGERFDDPPAGLDETDWQVFMAILYAHNYQGGLSIEPHSKNWQDDLGAKGLDFTVDYMKKFIF